MKRKKMLFVYNPHAGKATIRNKLCDIIDIFTKAGYEVTAYPTQKTGDAIDMVREQGHLYDRIVCSGGDGTLDETVTGMIKSGIAIPIGYIPAGSTNDFANSLHIPKNMLNAAKTAVEGQAYACDIGSFNDDVFVYIAAFGMFTDVSYETSQDVKNILGHMAYILEGMKRLPVIPSYHMNITYEDMSIEDEFMFGMITNSESVGGFKKITGRWVEMDDGLFEVTLIKTPKNPIELNAILAALLMRDIDTKYMYCFKTKHIEIEAAEEIAWTLDGEFGGKHKKITIDNCEKAINIMISAQNV